MSHTNRPLAVSLVLTLAMLLSGCRKPTEPKPEPKPVPERVPEKPKGRSFVPPTAERRQAGSETRAWHRAVQYFLAHNPQRADRFRASKRPLLSRSPATEFGI